MRTVCSLQHQSQAGQGRVFDFVVERGVAGWFRHEFDSEGSYAGIARTDISTVVAALAEGSPATCVIELRCAAAALEHAIADLLRHSDRAADELDLDAAEDFAHRAAEVAEERRRALVELSELCERAWDEAVLRVEQAREHDVTALPSAIRTVELLWGARRAVRRLMGSSEAEAA
jgi:hypothetical protein